MITSDFITTMLAVNAIATLTVGAYVYIASKNRLQNAVWFVYNILFCIWSFSIYKALSSDDNVLIAYWFRASFAALTLLVPSFLHFLSSYSDRSILRNRILINVYVVSFFFFAAVFIVPTEFIKGITSGIHFRHVIVPGVAFNIFVFVFSGFFISGFYYLLRSSKLYLRFKRNQRMWTFLGMLFGASAPASFLISTYFHHFFPIGIFFVMPYLALTGYTIIKYHVLEMDIVINKTVLMSYFMLFVLFVHTVLVHLLHKIVGMEYFTASIITGSVILVTLLFTAHYSGILHLGKMTEKIVYEKKLDYYKFLEDFTLTANKVTDLKALADHALNSLLNIVGIESAALYMYDEERGSFTLVARSGKDKIETKTIESISTESPLIKFLKEGNVYVDGEEEDFVQDYDMKEINGVLKKINAKLSIPLCFSFPVYHSKDIIGFLSVGNKKDKTPYGKEDVDILNAFGRRLSMCIDNIKLYSRAVEDDLTKLYRVNYFNNRLQEEVGRAERYNRSFSLLLIDVDDFKKINDTFGHQAGDETLRTIARLIKANIRKSDIAARCGGEEFNILMPETSMQSAFIAAERIRKSIEDEFAKRKTSFVTTVSIGVTEYKKDTDPYQLIRSADKALYIAKREGKNRVAMGQ